MAQLEAGNRLAMLFPEASDRPSFACRAPAPQEQELICLQRLQNSRIVTQSVLEAPSNGSSVEPCISSVLLSPVQPPFTALAAATGSPMYDLARSWRPVSDRKARAFPSVC